MRCDVCRTPLPGSGPPNGTAPWYICRQCQRGGAALSCALLTLARGRVEFPPTMRHLLCTLSIVDDDTDAPAAVIARSCIHDFQSASDTVYEAAVSLIFSDDGEQSRPVCHKFDFSGPTRLHIKP